MVICSLRCKRFRWVWQQRKTKERDFWYFACAKNEARDKKGKSPSNSLLPNAQRRLQRRLDYFLIWVLSKLTLDLDHVKITGYQIIQNFQDLMQLSLTFNFFPLLFADLTETRSLHGYHPTVG